MRKTKSRSGFTMAEVILTVGIILILGALGGIAVFKYQRTLEQLELDNAAQEIFAAAQNHLSASYSQGYLAKTDFGTAETESDPNGAYYFIVGGGEGYDSRSNGDSVLSTILPFAALDETVLERGSYIIRYYKDSGTVLDVFYAKKDDGRFGTVFTRDNYPVLLSDWADTSTESRRALRLHYTDNGTDAVIGYYGGAEGSQYHIEHGQTIQAPSFKITNGDELLVTITDTNAGNSKASLALFIEGETSGVTKEVLLVKDGAPTQPGNVMQGTNVYTLVLDSVTRRTSGGNPMHFAALYGSDGLLPGENLTLWLEASSSELSNIADSGRQTTNSLFASYSGGTAEISSFRHLENLSYRVSGFTGSNPPVSTVRQTTDLNWLETGGTAVSWVGSNPDTNILGLNGSELAETCCFVPLRLTGDRAIRYEGQGHIISGLRITACEEESGCSGLFAVLGSGSSVRNLILADFDVTGDASCAGALAGRAAGTEFTDILVYNSDDNASLGINGAIAGGLAGDLEGCQLTACAAAVYVRSEAADGCAGGLVGRLGSGNILQYSYSGGHTYLARYQELTDFSRGHSNVIAAGNAGGLAGTVAAAPGGSNGSTFTNCYSTCSVYSTGTSAAAGGFVGVLATASVTGCYCTGRVSGPAERSFFVGRISAGAAPVFAGTNYYLTNISVLSRADKARLEQLLAENENYKTHVIGVDGESTENTEFILPEADRQIAYTYDSSLTMEYVGRYYFPTADQLRGGSSGFFLTSVHYGDWQLPKFSSIDSTLSNSDKLTLTVHVDQDDDENPIRTVAFSVLGEESGIARLFKLSMNDDGSEMSLTARGFAVNGATTWLEEETPQTGLQPTYTWDENGKISSVSVVLDSVTDPGLHFSELFADDSSGRNLKPGENIVVQTISSPKNANFSWSEFNASAAVHFNNSLFEADAGGYITGGADNTASITNIRHLQNLDTAVSGVDPMINKALLLNDISWDGEVYGTICAAGGTGSLDGSFLGIRNDSLRDFDGRNHTISNLPVSSAYSALTGTAAEGAGLFREAVSLRLHDLQLKDLVIDGAAACGYAVGCSTGTVTLTNVLARSKELTVAGTTVGGLVGRVDSGSLTLKNCAAVVKQSGVTAGGLVGCVKSGTLELDTCYAGGHTVLGKFAVSGSDPSVYNVVGSDYAGGLVGFADIGTAVTVRRSFSAASVGGVNYRGGLFGRNSGTVRITDSTYCIAPVYNTGTASAGALIGASSNAISVSGGGVYYLPEVYKKAVVAVGGTADRSGLKDVVKKAFYDLNKDNYIAAADSENQPTLAYKTIPYDTTLLREAPYYSREYPYSIWTSFNFSPDNGNPAPIEDVRYYGIYYGDWEPVDAVAESMRNIDFAYLDPESGALTPVPDHAQWRQKLILDTDNRPLTPFISGMTGYTLTHWTVYDAETGEKLLVNGFPLTLPEENGFVELPAEYCTEELCGNGIILAADFVPNNQALVNFYYDPTGKNLNFVNIGQARIVEKGTPLSEICPDRSVPGHRLKGWYTDRALTQSVDPETETVQGTSAYYAKYETAVYTQITVDFLYEIKGERRPLYSVPRYQVDGQPQYKINFDKNTIFDAQLDMPVTLLSQAREDGGIFHFIGCGNYSENDKVNTISYEEGDSRFRVHAESEAHYYILYEIEAETAYEELENLVHFSIKYVYRNSAWKDHPGVTDGTGHADWELVGGTGSVYEIKYANMVDMIGSTPNIRAEDLSDRKLQLLYVERKPLSADESQNVYTVEYERPTYAIVFNPQSGIYDMDPITGLRSGDVVNLTRAGVTAANREGYSFQGWKYYDLSDNTEIPVKHEEYSHTHSADCYSGISSVQLQKDTRTEGSGCDKKEVTYYYYQSGSTQTEVTLAGSFNFDTSPAEFTVQSYTENGKTGYVIRRNGGWYLYSNPGNTPGGMVAAADACTYTVDVGDKLTMPGADVEARAQWSPNTVGYRVAVWYENPDDEDYSYVGSVQQSALAGSTVSSADFADQSRLTGSWKDSSHFTYNGDRAQSAVVRGDGSTVLNVYFSRNTYTLLFVQSSRHSHDETCYENVGVRITTSGFVSTKYYLGSREINKPASASEGGIVAFTYKSGGGSGKLIYIDGDYYEYTGPLAVGQTATPSACENNIYSITAKYMSLIRDEFPITTDKKQYEGYSWIDGNEEVFSYALQTLDRMPDLKGAGSLTFYGESRGSAKSIYYYVECLSGEAGDKNYNGKNFKLYKTVKHNFNWITRDEEFHLIEGYDRYAFTDGSRTYLYSDYASRKEYDYYDNANSLYYTRKLYPLEFYVGASTVAGENVQYEAPLATYAGIEPSATRPSNLYSWGGWYLNPEFTGEPVDLTTMTMPLGGLALYGRWVAPVYTVRFFADKNAAEPYMTRQVEYLKNLDGVITDNSGAYLPGVIPDNQSGEYFNGFFDKATDDRFLISVGVTGNMDLYAKFGAEYSDSVEALIRFRYETTDGKTLEIPDAPTATRAQVGQTVSFTAPYVNGYYPLTMVQGLWVSQNEADNIITFRYKATTTWKYAVEIYIRLSSLYDAVTVDGKTVEPKDKACDYLLSRTIMEGDSQFVSAYFDMPSDCEGYLYTGYEFNGLKGKTDMVTVYPTTTEEEIQATVCFYISPDVGFLSMGNQHYRYDGTPKGIESAESSASFMLPSGVSGKLTELYRYTLDGKTIGWDEIVDVGRYGMEGSLLFQVSGKAVGDTVSRTRYFLLWQSAGDSLNLTVAPRYVKIISDSARKSYDGSPLRAPNYSLSEESDGFLEGDGVEVIFSVEAFRLNKGIAQNSFIYRPLEGCEERLQKNYVIEIDFGTLEVN